MPLPLKYLKLCGVRYLVFSDVPYFVYLLIYLFTQDLLLLSVLQMDNAEWRGNWRIMKPKECRWIKLWPNLKLANS